MKSDLKLEDCISYDPNTGEFSWVVHRKGAQRGARKGCCNGKGYLRLSFDGKSYYSHRLAWFLHHGEWPSMQIDHINGDKSDNRIENLRLATNSQNIHNRRKKLRATSVYKGVYLNKRDGTWVAKCTGKHIGTFSTELEAAQAYKKVAEGIYKEFFNDGISQ